jgi:acetyl esterase/lipase
MRIIPTLPVLALSLLLALATASFAAVPKPVPTKADVNYGSHPHQILDLYLPPQGTGPFPVVVWFGGLWAPGKGAPTHAFLPAGCAAVAVEMRTMGDAIKEKISPPVSVCLLDARRAVQFVRLHAAEWNLDPNRIAVAGGSQGALPALYVGCAGEKADPDSTDPVERVSTKVTCAGAWRSQPSVDPKRMQEWVPGVEWGVPAWGCSFAESLKRREELLPLISKWSPEALVGKDTPPIYFEYDWGLTKPDSVTEMDYLVHSPRWGLGFQKMAREHGATCYLRFPGNPSEKFDSMWDFLLRELGVGSATTKSVPVPAPPRISGPYVHVYAPGADVFPGPDSENFRTGRSYAEWIPNDHAILKGTDGRWHALGITHPKPRDYDPPRYGKDVHEAEWLLFHAVSPKGKLKEHLQEGAWRDAKKVLAPAARPGEIKECHAPFIVQKDGIYHMIYGPNPLRMATSSDLYDWKPVGALFTQKGGARDPSIIRHGNQYILLYVTGNTILARTSSDLRNWSAEAAEIFRMRRGGDPESPTIVERDGQFYLFWCLWDAADMVNGAYDNRTFVYRSANPMDFRDAPCVAQLQAHAPEVFRDEDGDWFISSVEWPKRGVSIAPLVWK